ncbi:V-type proton ATPase subunit D-like [Amyelois transitella]|uniref:V-type proton ATPase subunit D-like n=1 Tax=Amyelois transitella TaxID=680683 RepID=UPI0029902514|nr:V-type proton ATPase subunit D-like [Amyelois transitella]
MNAENRYPVNASLFMLGEIKRRQEHVTRGYQLLKRKAEALRIRGRQAASEMVKTQVLIGHALKEAFMTLAAVKFTNGDSNAMVLENVGQANLRVKRVPENISGVSTVSLYPVEDLTLSDASRYSGLASGGHRTAEAKKAFRQVLKILVKFASLRNTCILLDESLRSTLRKLNGIEKVIMPKLRNTESYIRVEMDEREREEFHRLKMVKAKKNRSQYLNKLRRQMERDTGESGDSTGLITSINIVPASSSRKTSLCPATIMLARLEAQSTSADSAGDYQPFCYPHNWDDDDLLF